MTRVEAVKVLKAHQDWRRHEGDTPEPMPYSPKAVGEAIDVAIVSLLDQIRKVGKREYEHKLRYSKEESK